MAIRKIAAGLAGLATCTAAMAQGSFNFDEIPGVDQEPIVAVDVNPVMIGFFRSMAAAANPDAPDVFSGLRSIKLRVYHADADAREFSTFIQDVAGRLEGQGWQRLAAVQARSSAAEPVRRMPATWLITVSISVRNRACPDRPRCGMPVASSASLRLLRAATRRRRSLRKAPLPRSAV